MVLEGVVVEIVRNLDVHPHDIERVREDGERGCQNIFILVFVNLHSLYKDQTNRRKCHKVVYRT